MTYTVISGVVLDSRFPPAVVYSSRDSGVSTGESLDSADPSDPP